MPHNDDNNMLNKVFRGLVLYNGLSTDSNLIPAMILRN